jgi:hypothetical protein
MHARADCIQHVASMSRWFVDIAVTSLAQAITEVFALR